jgi:predicted amidophosphoribosyltransferase
MIVRMPLPFLLSPFLSSPVLSSVRDALAVVVPVVCAGCGVLDAAVCRACRAALVVRVTRIALPAVEVSAALRYEGVVATLLGGLKESGRLDVLRALAPAMRAALADAAACVAHAPPGCVSIAGVSAEMAPSGFTSPVDAAREAPLLVVPVPSSKASVRRRGYRPVEELVRRAGTSVASGRTLVFRRSVADQAGLSRGARAANVHGAMAASRRVRDRRVMLVDDVVTSGASIAEAARAVTAAGGFVVAAACLSHTVKRQQNTSG